MNIYKTNGIVTITGGVLLLSPHQARARLHALKHEGGDEYQVLLSMQLKAGEVFGFDGELPKHLDVELVEIDKPKTEKPKPAARARSIGKSA